MTTLTFWGFYMTHEGSPTSHGHNSLTVRSYVMFHIPPEMAWQVLSIQNILTFQYIKTHTIINQTNLVPLPKPFCYRNSLPDFLQGLTSMETNPNNQQYFPLALMETLWWNNEVISLMLPLESCLCPLHLKNLSPFVINGKGIFPSKDAPPAWTLPETDLPT